MAKPFTLSKKQSSAISQSNPNPLVGMTKPEDVDKWLNDLNTPGLADVDFSASRRVLQALEEVPEKNCTEEIELNNLFK